MDWKFGLAVFLLATQCYTEDVTKNKQPEEQSKSNSTQSASTAEGKKFTKLTAQQIEAKATETLGSVLPPNPEIIVSLQSPENIDLAEVSKLKKSSKFRNVALGSTVAKVKESEVDIQNLDGANPHFPPFAFNGDATEAQSKSIREIQGPDEDLLKTTPSYTTTPFEQAKIMESLKEIDQSGGVEQKSEWTPSAAEPRNVPHTVVSELVDTVSESITTTPFVSTTVDGEVLDPIAEYNRKVLELAKRRKMLKEQGYKEYKKIMFKSGRNIVPVRLFFDTDPHVVELPQDSFKRSITPITPNPENTPISQESFEDLTKSSEKVGFATETKEELVRGLETTTLITDITAPNQTRTELLSLNRGPEQTSEDIAGSGLPPPATTTASTETQEELLSGIRPSGTIHVVDVVHNGGEPASVESIVPASFPEDITRFEKMAEINPAPSPSTVEQSNQSSAQLSEGEAKEKLEEINGQIIDDIVLSESTTSAVTTSSEVLIEEPTITVPVPPEPSTADSTTTNLSQTLPPLLSMPPLSALSSFTSLSTPVKVATRPRRPLKTSTERPVEIIRKSSGISGSSKKPRRKLSKDRKISVDAVGTQGNNVVGTRPVNNSERQRLTKHRISTISEQSTQPEFTTTRRITRPTRPNGVPHHAVLVGHDSGQAAVIKSTRPDREIYEHTFRFNKQRPFHVRPRNHHRQFIRQGASPTDTRSTFSAPKELTAKQTPSIVLATVASVPAPSPLMNRPATSNVFNRLPTFGPSHQQAPAVQLPLVQAGISALPQPHVQQQLAVDTPLMKTLTPPVNVPGQSPPALAPPIIIRGSLPPTSIAVPLQPNNNVPTEAKPRLSEWDRIRAEFLRIKRQQRKLRQQQRQNRARAASGVKTLSGKTVPSSVKRSHRRRHVIPHNGEISRGVVWREGQAAKDPRALRVDVDRSRRTIDRDAIVNL